MSPTELAVALVTLGAGTEVGFRWDSGGIQVGFRWGFRIQDGLRWDSGGAQEGLKRDYLHSCD
jgi:hypothetical protein